MAATVASDLTDGPVLSVITKRLRALRKKYNRIIQMEESVSQGKALNKEQKETLCSKPYVIAGIDELEKLKQPLSVALSEEISTALQRQRVDVTTPTTNSTVAEPIATVIEEDESEKPEKSDKEEKQLEGDNGSVNQVEDLLKLLYFGSMFDVKSQHDFTATMLTRTHERGCCLTYDYVTDDDAADLLGERDLDLISMLGGLLISRPVNSSLSHKNALLHCIEHAKLWLARSDQPIEVDSSITYAGLRDKLNKIMCSDYFTATPEMRAPVEMAAAAGTYASFQVPVHGGSVVSVDAPVSVQASSSQHEHQVWQEEEVTNPQGDESYENQNVVVEELNQGDGGESFTEFPTQTDELAPESEQIGHEFEKGQHYAPRRSFQSHRGGRGMGGGGRRGYPNGRGGRGGSRGGYANGRQYYDYPRNYFRGRGGRGAGGSYPGQGSYLVGDT
ncbi:hypothetical protein M9H77_10046 [Catharanthus roseus]|uniref:Uncharacterized protein n=1 Tax=Catharanthus roseus TaxID=4058 RepID=A0ACC0C2D1_CATRO|nr:hypothetical protein M9H77_10046 [Catharanthus roseus]